ncbi:MAG TPA: Ig-like domain repeat protein [Acidobacteriaceae bacterium]|nr:Ig-like domain repeat protein [Acidobacteriaceae bacterium]
MNVQAQSFTGGPITVSGTQFQSVGSSVTVSGLSGTVNAISLQFNNLNVTNLDSIAVVLVSPSGQAFDLLSGVCGEGTAQVGASTFTLADSGDTGTDNDTGYLSGFNQDGNPVGTCPAAYTGTYLPTDYYAPNGDTFSSPGPATYASGDFPGYGSGDTFATAFTLPAAASGLNGQWTLYIANQIGDANGSLGSWSLFLATSGGTAAATTTSLSTNASGNETTTASPVTLTATVTSSGTVSSGTVTFTDNGNNVACSGGNPVVVSNGTAACTASFTTEGSHPLTATYSGSTDFSGSGSDVLNLFVDHPTTNPSPGKYCNAGGLSISGSLTGSNNPASPYPSHIDVTGYSGSITGATLSLNGFSDANPQQTAMLLVGPTSTNIVPWDNVGGTAAVNNINFTLADSAGSLNTIASPPANGETYYPTANIGTVPAFPSPAPTTLGFAPSLGSQTFTNAFAGISPAGEWSLYLYNSDGSTATSASNWCITLLSQTSMTLASSHTGSFTQGDAADTYTITAKNGGTIPTNGELTLSDSLPSGMSAVSFAQTGGSDWSCSGASCTRTTAMPVGEQDTFTLTASVGYATAIGTNSVTNSVTVSGGNLSGNATANDPTTINGGPVNVTFSTNPTGFSYSANGISDSTQQTLTNGTAITLSTTSPQTPSTVEYLWTGWSDGGAMSHTATISSTTGTAAYTANFAVAYTLTTGANPSIGGTVSPSSGTNAGVVDLTATPNTGWAFTTWTGSVANANNASTTITMSGNETATANFAPNGQTTVWIVNSIGGLSELTAAGDPATTTPYNGGNEAVAIDATGNLWTLNSSSPLLYEANQLGTQEHSISTGGGLNAPFSLAIDGGGQVWVTNGNSTVSLFSNTGMALSPSSGFTDSSLSTPSGIAIDLGGSVWIANKGASTLTRILGAAAPAAPLSTAAKNNTTGARP